MCFFVYVSCQRHVQNNSSNKISFLQRKYYVTKNKKMFADDAAQILNINEICVHIIKKKKSIIGKCNVKFHNFSLTSIL